MNLFRFYLLILTLFFYFINIHAFEDQSVFQIFRHLRILENLDDEKDPEKNKKKVQELWKKILVKSLKDKLFLSQNPLLKKDFADKIKNAEIEKLFQKILVNNKIDSIKLSEKDIYNIFIKVLYKKLKHKEYQDKLEKKLMIKKGQ